MERNIVQSGGKFTDVSRGSSFPPIPGNQTKIFLTDAAINFLKLQHLSLVRND